jgi:glutathione S-transferase
MRGSGSNDFQQELFVLVVARLVAVPDGGAGFPRGDVALQRCVGTRRAPAVIAARAHCRAVSGEMHSGFTNLRSALPMNLKSHYPGFKIWASAQADIDRVTAIWRECLKQYGGPYLFGAHMTLADAMYAPVATRFQTYDVKLDRAAQDYCETILSLPDMQEWVEAAKAEPAALEELEAEF